MPATIRGKRESATLSLRTDNATRRRRKFVALCKCTKIAFVTRAKLRQFANARGKLLSDFIFWDSAHMLSKRPLYFLVCLLCVNALQTCCMRDFGSRRPRLWCGLSVSPHKRSCVGKNHAWSAEQIQCQRHLRLVASVPSFGVA